MTIKELREKRAQAIYEMRDIVEVAKKENADGLMTEEQRTRWERLETDEASLKKEIDIQERQERLNKEMAEKKVEEEPAETKSKEQVYEERFLRYLSKGDIHPEMRTTQDGQSIGTPADGGYLVPQSWASQIETAQKAFGGMLEVASIITTPGGGQMNWPTCNDTSNKSAILAEESVQTESKVTFGSKQLDAYVLATPIIPISMQLVQDANYDIVNYIINLMAERDARGLNYYATVGSGNGQHNGVVTASTKGEDAAAAALTRDNLLDLLHSVDYAYRQNGVWMFNDSTLKAIKALSIGDADSRPLWQPGIAFGEPDTIEGKRYVINEDMADIGAGLKSVLFGDFSKYLIRRVAGFNIVRFNEKYMNSLQVAVMGWSRSDGELLDAGTNPIKHILHAST